MKLSDVIAQYLVCKGIKIVFGYQGGSITHLIDSFSKKGIRYIQSYNEQGAGLAADSYARVSATGLGVAIGTNGPGATNLITAIANAYCDSVPVLFITGQVHTFAMRKSELIRQESFQEIDIVSMIKPITKYCVTVINKDDALYEIDKAINIALEGRKGPVLIDLPVDVQGMDLDEKILYEFVSRPVSEPNEMNCEPLSLDEVIQCLKRSVRPLVIAGGGIRGSDSVAEFRQFIRKTGIPVVTSLMGLDTLNHNDERFVGFIGTYGNRYANITIQNSDLLIVMGSRLDLRQTGKNVKLFAPKARIIHIDIDREELGHHIKEDIQIACDLKRILTTLNIALEHEELPDCLSWNDYINRLKKEYSSCKEFDISKECNPNLFMKKTGEIIPKKAIVTFDVGQNQMWAAQSLRIAGDHIRILNSGGLGTMVYSLPAGIGACFASSDSCVISIMGDGGLQMNIQELQMVKYYKLPLKVIVFRNHALGLIRDIQEKYYEKKYVGSITDFSVPPLDKIANTYDMKYIRVNGIEEICQLEKAFVDSHAYLIDILFDENTYVRPELLGMNGIEKQSPYLE